MTALLQQFLDIIFLSNLFFRALLGRGYFCTNIANVAARRAIMMGTLILMDALSIPIPYLVLAFFILFTILLSHPYFFHIPNPFFPISRNYGIFLRLL